MTTVAPSVSKRLPPGPRSWLPGGIFRELRKGPLDFITNLTRNYGDISSFRAVGQRYVVLNHPDFVREVMLTQADAFWKGPALQNSKGILGEGLLTAEGETHRAQRKLMTPAFHAKHVESYAGEIIRATRDVVEQWRARVDRSDAAWDVRPEMMGLTLVIAGNALFGTMLSEEIETVHRCMDDLMNNYVRSVVPWGWILNRLPLESTKKLKRAQSDMQALVGRMIAKRRAELESDRPKEGHATVSDRHANGGEADTKNGCPFHHGTAGGAATPANARRDLLSMMIAATDDEIPLPGGNKAGVRLTDIQLRDQSITILTAGHETTANAMTFTLYLLAKHPDEQRKLREEIRAVVGTGEPTVEMMDRFVRTRWVLSESMRLLPPAWTLGRQNRREVELGGYRLPPKCTILIPQWTLHRDPRFWEEPLRFRPERWREPKHPRFAYFPFSTGPRNCIGESFAWVEMLLALPMLVKDFEYSLSEETKANDLRLTPAITLRPAEPVRLIVRPAL